MKTIADLIGAETRQTNDALQQLTASLAEDGPIVTWLQGEPGRGMSTLLDTLVADASDYTVYRIDCGAVEPTYEGLARELSQDNEGTDSDINAIAARLSEDNDRLLLIFENYALFRLADGWLRRDFIPALGTHARIILSSSEAPSAGWVAAAEWRPYVAFIGLDENADNMASKNLDEIGDPELRTTLDAVCVVRRITKPMLAALCPEASVDTAWDTLAALPFVESHRDGLAISDGVQRELADNLRASDPGRYRELQRAAWRLLRTQLKHTTRADLWRTTADIIFLIENPVIREAFFPSEAARYSLDPALPEDREAILEMVHQHEPPGAVEAMQLWWKHLPGAFHTVRDANSEIVGFYCIARPEEINNHWMQFDPVAREWVKHIEQSPARPESLLLRRWLSVDGGECASAIQAAAWVDIKRTYLELRPGLRRVYLTLQDIGPYAAVATELGFAVVDEATAEFARQPYHTALLDFGPGSVDGWICNLVAAELGIAEEQLLDSRTREIILDGERVALTPLEFGVASMLEARDGAPVTRNELLEQVWGHGYDGGSNVVDAVVRTLRKKCGEHAGMFETVRGVGYRLQPEG